MSLIKHGIFFFMLACASSGVAGDVPSRETVLEARLSSLVQRVDANAIVLVRTTQQEGNEGVEQVDVKILSALPDFPKQIVSLVRQLCAYAGASVTVQVKPLPHQLMPTVASAAPATLFTTLVDALASPAANTILMLVALVLGLISTWVFVLFAAFGARRIQITFMNGVAHLSEAVRDSQARAIPAAPVEARPVRNTVTNAPAILLTAAQAPANRNTDTLDTEFGVRSYLEQERLVRSALDLQK